MTLKIGDVLLAKTSNFDDWPEKTYFVIGIDGKYLFLRNTDGHEFWLNKHEFKWRHRPVEEEEAA